MLVALYMGGCGVSCEDIALLCTHHYLLWRFWEAALCRLIDYPMSLTSFCSSCQIVQVFFKEIHLPYHLRLPLLLSLHKVCDWIGQGTISFGTNLHSYASSIGIVRFFEI